MDFFIDMLSNSQLNVGYLGLTDYIIPLYEDFFEQELMNPISDSNR